ncbi:MAG: hypothetical protein RIF33_05850 [Cyclobacteriaceae bacterium]
MDLFLKYILLPVLTIILAVLTLKSEKSEEAAEAKRRNNNIRTGVIFIIISVSVLNIIVDYIETNTNKRIIAHRDSTIVESNREIKELRTISLNLSSQVSGVQFGVDQINITLEEASTWGLLNPENKTAQELINAFNADEERTRIISSLDSINKPRVSIQYFPKNVDQYQVTKALEELNFNVTTGKANFPNTPTNAVFVGSAVDIESVKLILLTLIRAGVEIQEVRNFDNSLNREYLVQIGSYPEALNRAPIEIESISQAKNVNDFKVTSISELDELSNESPHFSSYTLSEFELSFLYEGVLAQNSILGYSPKRNEPNDTEYEAGIKGLLFYSSIKGRINFYLQHKGIELTSEDRNWGSIKHFEFLAEGIPAFQPGSGQWNNIKKEKNGDHTFSYYNPEIVVWGYNNLIPDPNTIIINEKSAQHLYSHIFFRLFRLMAESYLLLQNIGYESEIQAYKGQFKDKDFRGVSYLMNRYDSKLEKYKLSPHPHYALSPGMAVGFWLRRGIDGTSDELWEGLTRVLITYDRTWYNSVVEEDAL